MTVRSELDASLPTRLWVYQSGRLPLLQTVPLLGAFSASSVTASARLSGHPLPGLDVYLLAFFITTIFFWQMRALEELKDARTERRYGSERPVARRLIPLRIVLWIGGALTIPALLAAYSLAPMLFLLALLTYGWLLLMTFEFFVPKFLSGKPALYLLSHVTIMPLIDLVLTGCEWAPRGSAPAGIWAFLLMSLCNGCVMEFGRKTLAPEQERRGVATCSRLWGRPRALAALAVMAFAAYFALVVCGLYLDHLYETAGLGLFFLVALTLAILRFAARPDRASQKQLETVSGLWVLACYLIAAFAPGLSGF